MATVTVPGFDLGTPTNHTHVWHRRTGCVFSRAFFDSSDMTHDAVLPLVQRFVEIDAGPAIEERSHLEAAKAIVKIAEIRLARNPTSHRARRHLETCEAELADARYAAEAAEYHQTRRSA